MDSSRDLQWIGLYAAIMEEIKIRIEVINYILLNPQMTIAPIRREMAFLQLRMVCELVALGCLVAHGDIQATNSSDLRKAYAADLIMKTLEELRPDFYPIPFDQIRQAPGRVHLAEKSEPFMTKAELLRLVRQCGEALHRGSLKKLMKSNAPTQVHLPEVLDAANKFMRLLEHHRIALIGGRQMICILRSLDHDGRVNVAIAE